MNVEAPRAKAIFLDAVEHCEPQQWPQYLDEACAGDPPLRCRVEVLLRAHARSAGLLDELGHDVGPTVDEPASTELIGSSIGPYKLLEVIGEGGMGVVYMAERTHPVRRKVALKVIKPGMDTRQVIARFEAERQALAMMDHPNIARVFNADATESGRPYFVMELVRGIPITEYCDRERLSIPERLGLFVLVCRAVQHAAPEGGDPPGPEALERPGHGHRRRRRAQGHRLRRLQGDRDRASPTGRSSPDSPSSSGRPCT